MDAALVCQTLVGGDIVIPGLTLALVSHLILAQQLSCGEILAVLSDESVARAVHILAGRVDGYLVLALGVAAAVVLDIDDAVRGDLQHRGGELSARRVCSPAAGAADLAGCRGRVNQNSAH